MKKYINILITIGASMFLGSLLILAMGHNPLEAYTELFRGAFVGNISFGTTLARFVPVLLTAFAFVVSAKVGVFNVGVEGQMYLGAIAAAWVGFTFSGLFGPIHIFLCFVVAAFVGMMWAYIPGILKVKWGVNEICVTIMLNYIAVLITSWLATGPFSARVGIPRTHSVSENVLLTRIMPPSVANTGIFIAIAIVIVMLFIFYRTTLGYQLKTVGLNPDHAQYIGIDPKRTVIKAMLISGAIGGITGAIEVLGVFGHFLDNFSDNIAFNGMLVALLVKNDPKMVPFMAFFLAILQSGALGMERNSGVPRSVIDVVIAIFIVFACAEIFSQLRKRRSLKNAKAIEGEVA
jgi:simple sugar transport system permease protein